MKLFLTTTILLILVTAQAQIEVRTGLGHTSYHFSQEDIPKGELKGPFDFHSKILAGTVRQYWIYVPAQYKASEAANLLIFHDGYRATQPEGSLRVPQVLENLIGKEEIPTTIGLFISPGNRSTTYPTDLGWSNPNNRAQEYDAMDNTYGRFIVEEMLPLLKKDYNITDDPKKRAIGGTSSGAIAAFTVAWHFPEAFGKVYSSIGSYVSIGFRPKEDPVKLGGQDYPALIRREPIRPIDIFLQDGTNDLDNEWGNWFLANQQMEKALRYANRIADKNDQEGARYRVKSVWTDGEHNDKHPGALLPEGLKWLFGE
ncbi:MAG: esterase family protein [Cyclobacteriaceae bacterium]